MKRRLISGFFAALLVVVLFGACGNPADMLSIVDTVLRIDSFGGALARLYSSQDDDEFFDAVDFEEVLAVVGSSVRSGMSTTGGIIFRIQDDGNLLNRQMVTSDAGDVEFRATGVGEGDGGDRLLLVGGFRENDGRDEGLVMQLTVGSTGAVEVATSLLGTRGGDDTTDADDRVYDVAGSNAKLVAVGVSQRIGDPGNEIDTYGRSHGLYSIIPLEDGAPTQTYFVSGDADGAVGAGDGHDLVFSGVAVADPYYAVTGAISEVGGPLSEGLLLATIENNGDLLPDLGAGVSEVTLLGNSTGAMQGTDIAWLGESRFVVVGSTQGYFGGEKSWFVAIVERDDLFAYTVVGAWAINLSDGVESSAQSVVSINLEPNYFGDDTVFAVTGDSYETVLMDETGQLIWAAVPSDRGTLLQGNAYGIATNGQGGLGFFVVGRNNAMSSPSRGTDGSVLWVLPDDGTSFPETETASNTGTNLIQEITGDIVVRTVEVLVSTSADPPGSLVGLSEAETGADISAPGGTGTEFQVLDGSGN